MNFRQEKTNEKFSARMNDELTFELTPAQAAAVRAYVARCEREFLRSLREDTSLKAYWLTDWNVAKVDSQTVIVRGEVRALSEFDPAVPR